MRPTAAAGALVGLSAAFVGLLDASLYFRALSPLVPVMLALIVPALLAGNALAWRIVRAAPGPVPAWMIALATLHFLGGAAFDMIATIVHTPDLAWEANPIAVALLDHGVPLGIIYGYAVVAQVALQALSILGVCGWLGWRRAFAAGDVPIDRETIALRLLVAWVPCDVLWAFLRWYLGAEWFAAGALPAVRDEHVLPVVIPLGILLDLLLARRPGGVSGRR